MKGKKENETNCQNATFQQDSFSLIHISLSSWLSFHLIQQQIFYKSRNFAKLSHFLSAIVASSKWARLVAIRDYEAENQVAKEDFNFASPSNSPSVTRNKSHFHSFLHIISLCSSWGTTIFPFSSERLSHSLIITIITIALTMHRASHQTACNAYNVFKLKLSLSVKIIVRRNKLFHCVFKFRNS